MLILTMTLTITITLNDFYLSMLCVDVLIGPVMCLSQSKLNQPLYTVVK